MNVTLHIDGQSTEVDVPPDIIIDVVDEDDDITDDEDALRHDLAESDNEGLINVDDDGVNKMSADISRYYGGDDRGNGKRKPNLGGRAAARLNTRDKTGNLSLKEITDMKGPVQIQFELRDKQTVMPLGDHAAHWSSYIGEVIRGVPLYYPSWLKVPKERKAALITHIGVCYPFMPHMEPPDSTEINKAAFKAQLIDPTTGTYNVEKIRRERRENITPSEWDKYRPQPLRSTCRSLTHSSWHTLLTGNFSGMRTDVYTGSGGCGEEEEGADHQDDEDEDDDGDTYDVFPETSRWGKESPATSRRGSPKLSLGKALNVEEEDNVITALVMVHPLRKECYELPSLPMCFGKYLGRKSCGLGFDTSTNTWKMVCVLLKEDAPPDKPDMVKKNLRALVHVFGTNSWREIPQVPSYLITGKAIFANGFLHWLASYSDIQTEDGGTPVIWFDVKKEEFGLIDPMKRMHDIRRNYSCLDQVVDLNGEVGYECTNIMEFWLLNHKKLRLPL
nr:hypothetical protein [Tanacetum cinerariifolium]